METDRDETFNLIYGKLESYIWQVCLSFSREFTVLGAADLRQECAIKLLELIEAYPELSTFHLERLFKVSMYNTLRDIYRAQRRAMEIFYRMPENFDFPEAESLVEQILTAFSVEIAKRMLDRELDRRMLELMLTPDRKLVRLAQRRTRQ